MLTIGSALPEYRTKAHNAGVVAGNLIHDDEHARRYGFRGGLVPGASLFAYVSRCLVELLGREWLERGSAEVRFVHPVYDGEEIRAGGCISSIGGDGALGLELEGTNSQGVTCIVGSARLTRQPPGPEPIPDDYPGGRNRPRRPISLDLLKVGAPLTPVTSEFTWNVHWEYCQKIVRDHHPIYRQLVHPGWLLSQANRILAENFEVTAWIQVASNIQNFHVQDTECTVETRGRIADKFERNGHHYVVLELAAFAGQRCLQTIRFTVIFRIAPRAA